MASYPVPGFPGAPSFRRGGVGGFGGRWFGRGGGPGRGGRGGGRGGNGQGSGGAAPRPQLYCLTCEQPGHRWDMCQNACCQCMGGFHNGQRCPIGVRMGVYGEEPAISAEEELAQIRLHDMREAELEKELQALDTRLEMLNGLKAGRLATQQQLGRGQQGGVAATTSGSGATDPPRTSLRELKWDGYLDPEVPAGLDSKQRKVWLHNEKEKKKAWGMDRGLIEASAGHLRRREREAAACEKAAEDEVMTGTGESEGDAAKACPSIGGEDEADVVGRRRSFAGGVEVLEAGFWLVSPSSNSPCCSATSYSPCKIWASEDEEKSGECAACLFFRHRTCMAERGR